MTTTAALVERIHRAEPGPHVAAAFDLDGTLVHGFTAKAFIEHRLRTRQMGPRELWHLVGAARGGIADEEAFAAFMAGSLEPWAGLRDDELDALGRRLFKQGLASQLHRETLELVEAHRRMGHTLVLASSALRYQTTPWAEELGMDHVLQTEVEVADGVLTGRVAGAALYGAQKARSLEALAAELELDLDASFAYSNGAEDVPFLAAVGHATAVEPDDRLAVVAREHGWPVLRCRVRNGRPGPVDLARTGAFYGTFFSTLGLGVGVGLLNRSRRSVLDVALGVGSELSLAVAGVQVDVLSGAEHLVGTRPAVFVFNHTSKMDAFVAMKLVRGEVTGIAKAEAKKVPVFGQLFQLAGMAFLDRSDPARAVEALSPVVEKLRAGTSIIVSPEGTRTPTPRLGPFKKGPFHVAMQAGVPIVPMLFRGVDEVQWRGAQVVRPGRVEVVVLPPVDTADWHADTVADHRDHVRALMLDALDAWPGAPRPPLLPKEARA